MQVQNLIDDKINDARTQVVLLNEEIARLEAQKKSAGKKQGMENWLDFRFESSSGLTEEFATFTREFKKHITSILPQGSELVSFSRGHFEVFGFIKRGEKFVYFSCSDVRYFLNSWYDNLLIRTAQHDKDYTGGSNCSTTLPKFTENVDALLNA